MQYFNKLMVNNYYRFESYLGLMQCAGKTKNDILLKKYLALLRKELEVSQPDIDAYYRIVTFLSAIGKLSYLEGVNPGVMQNISTEKSKHLQLGRIFYVWGNYYWYSNNFDKALENYQQAILTLLPDENRTDPFADLNYQNCTSLSQLWGHLNAKGETFGKMAKEKQGKEQIRFLKECLKNHTLSIDQMSLYKMQLPEEGQQLIFSDLYSQRYPNIIKVCLELYNITGDKYYHHLAFRYAEQGRAAIMLSMLRGTRGSRVGLVPAACKATEDSLNNQISIVNQQLAAVKGNRDAMYSLSSRVDVLVAKRKELEQLYKEKYPAYYHLKFSSEVTGLEQFQKSLSTNECVVEYLYNSNFLILFYIDHKNLIAATDTLKNINLEQLANRFHNSTSHFSTGHFLPDSIKQFADDAYQLYSILLKPFEKHLHGKKITIIADNALRKIPFEVLLTSKPVNLSGYRDLPYLVKQSAVYYAPSATFLNELRQRPALKGRARLLAVAPVYSSLKLNDTLSQMLLAVRSDTSVLGSLPNARKEIAFAHSVAGGQILEEQSATETRFKKAAGHYDIIHLATHGILSEPALQSKLLFAESNPYDDGFLHNYEIYNLHQSSQLVILSACNTGAGKNYGGEDVVSTGRGFLSSGSRAVIMTLWPVNDMASYELIKEFYLGLKEKLPVSDALQQSKLKYLFRTDNIHAHPYFWTGYVVYGDASAVLPVQNVRIFYFIGTLFLLIAALALWLIWRKKGHRSYFSLRKSSEALPI